MTKEKDQILKEKMIDAEVPGYEVELSPDEADELGAFEETALTEEEAKESSIDQEEKDDERKEKTIL